MKKYLVAITLLILVPCVAMSQIVTVTQITVSKAWARPVSGSAKNAAVYLEVSNSGQEADTLISASTDVAEIVDLHKTVEVNGVMNMVSINKLVVPVGSVVKFAPHSLHVMLTNVKHDLKVGDKFHLTLNFEKTGKIETEVLVTNDPLI